MKNLLTTEQIKHLNSLDSKKKKRKYLLDCILDGIDNTEFINNFVKEYNEKASKEGRSCLEQNPNSLDDIKKQTKVFLEQHPMNQNYDSQYSKLFNYLAHELNCFPLNSEMQEIIEICSKIQFNDKSIPQEFCVEITEDNKEILQKIYEDKNKIEFKNHIGYYLLTDNLFTYLDLKSTSSNGFRLFKIVSTEEFLRYIGKEDLIEFGNVPKSSKNIKPDDYKANHKEYDSDKVNRYLDDEVGQYQKPIIDEGTYYVAWIKDLTPTHRNLDLSFDPVDFDKIKDKTLGEIMNYKSEKQIVPTLNNIAKSKLEDIEKTHTEVVVDEKGNWNFKNNDPSSYPTFTKWKMLEDPEQKQFPIGVGAMDKKGIILEEKLNFVPTGNVALDSILLAEQSMSVLKKAFDEKERIEKEENIELIDFDLPKEEKVFVESLLEYNKTVIKCIQMKSNPTNFLNNYLIMIQKFYHSKTGDKIDFITKLFP